MSELTAPQMHKTPPGGVDRVYVDFGANTSGAKTGRLSAGDTITSCTVSVNSKPRDAVDLTLGSCTVPTNTTDNVNGRVWTSGEVVVFTATIASTQALGEYRLKLTATTTNGYTLIGFVIIKVVAN